jgi:exo-1,4-beta-D-glucosaminidase
LELRDARKELVSDNFYWLSGSDGGGLKALQKLPSVKLETSSNVETRGGDTVVTARVSNPTDRLAFFIQLAVTKGPRGEEALPVLWSDNYFSLPPHESRDVTARISTADVGGTVPILEVGGWNIESEYECVNLAPSKAEVKPTEPFTMTAEIANTFLDGSRVTLTVDGKPVAARWAWARRDKRDSVTFKLQLDEPGKHEIRVGNKAASIVVR